MTAPPWPVETLVPHGGPMVLLDEFVSAGEGEVTTAVRVSEDSLFYDPRQGAVPAWVGVEYMAQTISLYAGLQAKQAREPIRIGLLLGTRRYDVTVGHFRLGDRLLIHAREEWRDDAIAVFACRIETDRCLAEASLNVYQPRDPEAFLQSGAP